MTLEKLKMQEENIENNKISLVHKELEIKEFPIKFEIDEENKTIRIISDYNIEIVSTGSILTKADEKNTMIGKEVHLNP